MHKLENILVWEKSIFLAERIYQLSANFPDSEKFGLTSQVRRAVVSISSNIAEGAGRNSNKEFNHFLGIANGSSFEVLTQIVLSNKLKYIKDEEKEGLVLLINEIQKMIFGFKKQLSKNLISQI